MLAKLESILQSFPQLQPNALQNLPTLNFLSFLALDNANNSLTHRQMLQAPDKQDFLNSEETELKGLLAMNIWNIIVSQPYLIMLTSYGLIAGNLLQMDISLSTMSCNVPIANNNNMVWHFSESLSLVITWTTVCLVLLLSKLLNLNCCQVDFT